MADKIVQLKDKNSNNLYPISGSSLAESVSTGAIVDGAVTTAKIADGAVTASKIDCAPLDGTLTVVRAAANNNSFLKYNSLGMGILMLRYRPSVALQSGQDITLFTTNILPDGQYTLHMPLQGITSGNQLGIITFKENGEVQFYNSGSSAYNNWIRATIPFFIAQ